MKLFTDYGCSYTITVLNMKRAIYLLFGKPGQCKAKGYGNWFPSLHIGSVFCENRNVLSLTPRHLRGYM